LDFFPSLDNGNVAATHGFREGASENAEDRRRS